MHTKPNNPRYENCPFCDLSFIDKADRGNGLRRIDIDGLEELHEHIAIMHRKTWVRTGRKGRWMDIEEVERRAEAARKGMKMLQMGA